MDIPFIKTESLGNDYIFVNQKSLSKIKAKFSALSNLSKLSKKMCDRHRGIGADGVIFIEKIGHSSAKIKIMNRDGSEAELCGNGLRSAGLYIKHAFKATGDRFTVFTTWNNYEVEILKNLVDGVLVRTMLGSPSFDQDSIGIIARIKNSLGISVVLGKQKRILYCVAMPNPFAVIFVDNFDFDWQKEGEALENSSIFKNKANVVFVKIDSKKRITIRSWERGVGATSACGSGAAAATVISSLLEYVANEVVVVMPGGEIKTRWEIQENKIYQEGPARIVFSGFFIIDIL